MSDKHSQQREYDTQMIVFCYYLQLPVERALYFDRSEDEIKWKEWSFKILAYASKKGYKEVLLTKCKLGSDKKEEWTTSEKAYYVLMQAAWTQLNIMVL